MKKHLLPLLLIFVVLISIGCTNKNSDINDKVIVYATLPPQKEMIEAVGGDKVSVTILVPQGGDPHTADLKPSQLAELSKAKLYVMVGSGIEFELKYMDKIKDLNKNMHIVNSSKGIELIDISEHEHEEINVDHHQSGKDPHIWTSIINGKIMVENICDGLVTVDPKNKDFYVKNRDIYLKQLDEANQLITSELNDIPIRSFMIFHPSWGYFARDYNLKQIPIEIEGKEPTLQSLANTIEEAKAANIKTIFISPGFSSKAAEIITKEIGGRTEVLDPLAQNYVENLKITANKIKNQ